MQAGWTFETEYFEWSYARDFLSYTFMDEREKENFSLWLYEIEMHIDEGDTDCILWHFQCDYSYPSHELYHIFTDMIRYSHVYVSDTKDSNGTCHVYVIAQENETYEDAIIDQVDTSSIHPMAPLLALYYRARKPLGLPYIQ